MSVLRKKSVTTFYWKAQRTDFFLGVNHVSEFFMSGNTVKNAAIAREKGRDNQHKVAFWITVFQYSTRPLLLEYLQRKNRNIFGSLKAKRWIKGVDTDVIKEELLILDSTGISYSREQFPESVRYQKHASRINHVHVRHELTLQKYILSRIADFSDFKPAKLLDYSDNKRKIPDAVALTKSGKEAIEIERFHKSNQLVFQAFHNHAVAITKMRFYDYVTYVFPNQQLCDNYREKFNQEEWPVYFFDPTSRTYKRADRPFICPEKLRSRFEFVTMEFY